jgi:putative ABC transport system permease protein
MTLIAWTEYLALGTLATITAFGLSLCAAWLLSRFVFETALAVPVGQLALACVLMIAATTATGLLASRRVYQQPPLDVLRTEL